MNPKADIATLMSSAYVYACPIHNPSRRAQTAGLCDEFERKEERRTKMSSFTVWHWLILLIIGGIGYAVHRAIHLKPSTSAATPRSTPQNISPTSIVFWRHIVGMVLLVMFAPPYGISKTPTEFLGFTIGAMLIPLSTTAIIIALGALFFTEQLQGKKGALFIKIAWILTIFAIFALNYGRSP